MDDMAAYYSQTQPSGLLTYQYYQHPPPPPPPTIMAVVPPPPGAALPPAHHLHPQYVPHHQQQPMFGSYGPPQSSPNEVRTLFVAGLPEDVKPREIYNLFREFPGYESSHLRSPSNSSQVQTMVIVEYCVSCYVVGPMFLVLVFDVIAKHAVIVDYFTVLLTWFCVVIAICFCRVRESAVRNHGNACSECKELHMLRVTLSGIKDIGHSVFYVIIEDFVCCGSQGMVFDLENGSTLYIDLAKSNSRSKRTRIDDERAGSDKKARGSAPPWATPDSGVSSIHMPGMGNPAFNTNTIGYSSAQSFGNSDGNAVNDSIFANLKKCSNPYVPQNSIPCATLFVANLGPACNEQELMQVFSRYPGFLKMKMQSTYGAPVAFVDFQDIGSSTEALNSLQGTILHSSPAGEGMRLEILDMLNRAWVCERSPSNLHAGK
ncbi:RNA-binding domain superfamily [Sesbania bispinosa]|nr:RNA-binding domain superfamily [Sesbania bispinosa]